MHTRGKGVIVALVTLFLLALAPAPASAVTLNKMETQIQHLHNLARTALGLPKLYKKDCLDVFAERQARKMAKAQDIWHQDLHKVLDKCHMTFVGENVAVGYESAKAVQLGWMNSPGHKANILNKEFKRLGVGVAKGEDGRLYYAVVFGRK